MSSIQILSRGLFKKCIIKSDLSDYSLIFFSITLNAEIVARGKCYAHFMLCKKANRYILPIITKEVKW